MDEKKKNNFKVPKLWIDSLDLETDWIEGQITANKEIMASFSVMAKKCKLLSQSKRKERMRLTVLKNQYMDMFLIDFLKKKSIVISIKNKLVLDYFRKKEPRFSLTLSSCHINKKPFSKTSPTEFDSIMKELNDLLDNFPKILNKTQVEEKPFIDPIKLEMYKSKTKLHCEALMRYLYFEKTGRDRFKYGKYGLSYYDRTGKEPWSYLKNN